MISQNKNGGAKKRKTFAAAAPPRSENFAAQNVSTLPPLRCFGILLLLFFLPAGLSSMDWPVFNGKLTENFGMNDAGRPLLGDTFVTEGEIYAADPGELIFSVSEEYTGNFISPLGNWTAIDHGDGLVSIYARFGDRPEKQLPVRIGKGVTIAETGKSGWTSKNGFYFSFFDRRERQWVNPIVILNPLPDTSPPSIQSIKLTSGNTVFDLGKTRVIKQGRYTISVQASDRSETADTPIAPYRITCSLNGVEIGYLVLETFSARDGVLMIYRNGLVPVSQIYGPAPAVEAAGDVSFTRGQGSLDISVQDFAGNTRNASFRLFVE